MRVSTHQRVHVVFGREEYAAVQGHRGRYGVFAVPERHALAVGLDLDDAQVLHGMPEAAFLVRAHLDRLGRRVHRQPKRAERVIGAVHAENDWKRPSERVR